MSLREAALAYVHIGVAVLPLRPGGKKPHRMLGEHGGWESASSSVRLVSDWWSADPEANIGIACGRPSGLAVIDLDVKKGNNGMASFSAFLHEHRLDFPYAPLAATPSDGQHAWLAAPGITERQGILPGVDIKGDGGYVVAAPSRLTVFADGRDGEHGGEVSVSYRWVTSCPCMSVNVPGWLIRWAKDAIGTGGSSAGAEHFLPADALSRNGDVLVPPASPGERNRTMYRVACSLFRKFGTTPAGVDDVLDRLREIWEQTDQRDYPWKDVLTSVSSARRFIDRVQEAEDADAASAASWLKRHG